MQFTISDLKLVCKWEANAKVRLTANKRNSIKCKLKHNISYYIKSFFNFCSKRRTFFAIFPSPVALVFLAVRLPLLLGGEVEQGGLERAREGDDHGAGVIGVNVLLDLGKPRN